MQKRGTGRHVRNIIGPNKNRPVSYAWVSMFKKTLRELEHAERTVEKAIPSCNCAKR